MKSADNDDQSEPPTHMGRPRRFVAMLLIGAGTILSFILARWIVFTAMAIPSYSVPDLQSAVSVHAQFIRHRATERRVEFEVPKEHWPEIFSCLTPSEYDSNPAKWQEVGSMTIQTSDGAKVRIWLYHVSKGPGAFSVGKTIEHRSYYRGGDSAGLQNALSAAYAEAERRRDTNGAGPTR